MSRIFLAGAAGVIGRRLTPLLLAQGRTVWGSTRSPDKSEVLRKLGALPVLVDAFDAEALVTAVLEAKPEIVIHQLTDLAAIQDPAKRSDALARNARIRDEGTRNLAAAARNAGARRLIAQSIAWAYAPGVRPYGEAHPLDLNADGDRAVSVRASSPSSDRSSPRRFWKGWCCAMAGCTARAVEQIRRRTRPRSMSMPRPTPPCSRSIMASRAFSTSPTSMMRCRP
jgi:NAD dependent epimerase/dehydratase family